MGTDAELLFQSLQHFGYVDADGNITREFDDLENAGEMDLYSELESKREAIYDFLIDLKKELFDQANDILRDIVNWCRKTKEMAAQIYDQFVAEYGYAWPSDMTALCYSGSADPFIYLLNEMTRIDVKSIVLVGAPLKKDRWIENANVDNVVTVYGEKDSVFGLNLPFRMDNDFHPETGALFSENPRKINETVIELKGLGHQDYFYDPKDPGKNAEVAQKAADFIARVTAKAKDAVGLYEFLLRETGGGVTKDNNTGKYIVDLDRVTYND